jgi:uncharacterized protein (TIGR03083 family)
MPSYLSTAHLLPELDRLLLELLDQLSPADWDRQTIAHLWTVKDVAAHLLDGNLRVLSGLRDNYPGDPPGEINSYHDLVDYLNRLNADWVQAMRRISPQVLVWLLRESGTPFCQYYAALDPFAPAKWPVAWAGESQSLKWMHNAREYTEKFLHQQQIRHALNDDSLLHSGLYNTFLEECMFGLPFALKDRNAEEGAVLYFTVAGSTGSTWSVQRTNGSWQLIDSLENEPRAQVIIPADIAWILFSKSRRPEDFKDQIILEGDTDLAQSAVGMVSFMA